MPTLYIVATPIGNLSDITPRAVETLKAVSLIAAEDTRVTRKLLSAYGIHTPLISCHAFNERTVAAKIVRRMLDEGMDVACATDAGTPCLSDPGSGLVREAAMAGIEVKAVPGASAVAAALSVSGMDAGEFTFYGFLPRQKGEMREKLMDMARGSRIAVVFESPHRVIDLLTCVAENLPHTRVCVSCDLTKRYECTLRGGVGEALTALQNNPKAEKGEYSLVFQWDSRDVPSEEKQAITQEAILFNGLVEGLSLRESMERMIARGERRNAVYAAGIKVKAMLAPPAT